MPKDTVGYACTVCGVQKPKDELSTKKVLFSGIGTSSTVFRSRTVEWLCEDCLGKDSQYNFPRDMSRAERMQIAQAKRKKNAAQEENR